MKCSSLRPMMSVIVLTIAAIACSPARAQVYEFQFAFGSQGSGNGQFENPRGVAVDDSDNVYVVDGVNGRVQVFDNDGNFLSTIGTPGDGQDDGDGELFFPIGVEVDDAGNVLVADTFNYQVQIFDSAGNFLSRFGSQGTPQDTPPGQFFIPRALTVDGSGNIVVADTLAHRVQIFDSAGNFLSTFGSQGSGDGEFIGANGVAVDGSGNILVSDQSNDRIQIFDSAGNFLSAFGTGGAGMGNGEVDEPGEFDWPAGLVLDDLGNIIVADNRNHRVQIFDSAGNFLSTFGAPGTGDGQFGNFSPSDVALDGSGNLFVTDTNNHRVQVYTLIPEPTSLSLVAIGVLGCLAFRRRKESTATI